MLRYVSGPSGRHIGLSSRTNGLWGVKAPYLYFFHGPLGHPIYIIKYWSGRSPGLIIKWGGP